MGETSTKTQADGTTLFAGDAWFDPIEGWVEDPCLCRSWHKHGSSSYPKLREYP